MPHLDAWNARRRRLADAYREHLADLPIGLPRNDEDGRHVYHLFVITADDRDALQMTLGLSGIETGIHYPMPVHRQPVLKDLGYAARAFPNAERLAASSLSLPMYPELALEQVEWVAASIRRHYRG